MNKFLFVSQSTDYKYVYLPFFLKFLYQCSYKFTEEYKDNVFPDCMI